MYDEQGKQDLCWALYRRALFTVGLALIVGCQPTIEGSGAGAGETNGSGGMGGAGAMGGMGGAGAMGGSGGAGAMGGMGGGAPTCDPSMGSGGGVCNGLPGLPGAPYGPYLSAGYYVDSADSADFNGDGQLDLVTIDYIYERISVLFGKSNGTFQAKVQYSVPNSISSYVIRAGDVNGDGKPDLVATSGDILQVRLNTGNGTFGPGAEYTVPLSVTTGMAMADFNGDGHVDLAATMWNGSFYNVVHVRLNAGNGTFPSGFDYNVGSTPKGVMAKDLNGDGKVDLAIASSGCAMSVLLNNGVGSFQPEVCYGAGASVAIAEADLNADGRSDLVVLDDKLAQTNVFFNNGNGAFGAPVQYATKASPTALTISDVNADNKPDVIVGNEDSVSVFHNQGNGGFAPRVDYFSAQGVSRSILAGELNGDGKVDLAIASSGYNFRLLFQKQDGSFGGAVAACGANYPLGATATVINTADFNGDGKLDLALLNSSANTVSVLLGQGDGTFAAAVDYPTGNMPGTFATNDITGDGLPDIVVASSYYQFPAYLSVLVNQGNGTFGPKTDYPALDPTSLAIADFNGDGMRDVACANWVKSVDDMGQSMAPSKNSVSVWLNSGAGSLGARVDHDLGGVPISDAPYFSQRVLAAADLVGDAKSELVFAHFEKSQVLMLSNLGQPNFSSQSLGNPFGPTAVTLGDITGDGRPELFVSAYYDWWWVMHNDSAGQFSLATTLERRRNPSNVADFNADGLLDVAIYQGDKLSVLFNQGNGELSAFYEYPAISYATDTAIGDFNGDGRADVAMINGSHLSIMLNTCLP